jgi:hypothetical protein
MIPICTAGIIHPPRVDSGPCNRKDLENLPNYTLRCLVQNSNASFFENELSAAIACYFATQSVHPHRQVSRPGIGESAARRMITEDPRILGE